MQQTTQIVPDIEDIYTPHPPTTALALLPIAHLSHDDARLIWIYVNLVLVIGAVAWIIHREQFSYFTAFIALLISLTFQPLLANFEFGQMYGVLFVALTAIWYSYQKGHDRIAGILLGIILIMKTAGILLPLFFLIQRRWKTLLWCILTISIIGIMSIPIVGLEAWVRFFEILPEYSQRPSFAVTAYQSIPGYFKHHFAYHTFWNPNPTVDFPLLGTVLSTGCLLLILCITLLKTRFWVTRSSFLTVHDLQPKILFGALITLNGLISPVTLDYHYALLLLPILLLLQYLPVIGHFQKIIFLVAIFLLAIDYPYQDPSYSQTLLSLMAYPKLIGGLLLWGIFVARMSNSQKQSVI